MRIGWTEVLVIVLLMTVLFGSKKVPELARALGKSLSEFKKGREEGMKDIPSDKDKPGEKPV